MHSAHIQGNKKFAPDPPNGGRKGANIGFPMKASSMSSDTCMYADAFVLHMFTCTTPPLGHSQKGVGKLSTLKKDSTIIYPHNLGILVFPF